MRLSRSLTVATFVALTVAVTVPVAVLAASGPSPHAGGRAPAGTKVPKSTKSPPTAAADGRGPSAAAGHGPPARVAGRPATGVEAAAIRQAVTVSALISLAPAGGYRVTGIRVSRAVPAWAFALIEPAGDDLDPAVVVVHRTGTTSWTVEQIGTDAVGCGAAPREVLEEFAVDCRS